MRAEVRISSHHGGGQELQCKSWVHGVQQLLQRKGSPHFPVQEECVKRRKEGQGNHRPSQLLGSQKLLEANEMTHSPRLGPKAWQRGVFLTLMPLTSFFHGLASSSSL